MPRFSRRALDHGRRVRRRAEPGRRRHGHRPQRPGQGAGPRASDQRSQAQERDHVPRRRHGRLGDHGRALLLRRRRRPSADGRASRSPASRRPGRSSPGPGPTYLPDYVPDSAATGTAWSTGKKTIDERISQGPSTAVDVPGDNTAYRTVLELAQKRGMATGNVSTAEITDATPAVLASHISLRGCQGPNDTRTSCKLETKAAGGLGSIAEQEVDHRDRRHPRRRQGPLRPDARRLDADGDPVRAGAEGLPLRRQRGRPRRGQRPQEAGPRPLQRRATCRWSGTARRRRSSRPTAATARR